MGFGGLGSLFGGFSGGSATGGGNGGDGFSSGGIGNSSSENYDSTDESSRDQNLGNGGLFNSNQELRISGNNNTLTTTDLGAVSGALALAIRGIEGANTLAGQIVSSNQGLLQGALTNSREGQQGFTDAVEKIKTSDVRVLIFTGLAVVAVVAVEMFKKKGG